MFRKILGEPDRYIGGKENPYMLRWFIKRPNSDDPRAYLHNFLRDDDDRALHDHPANSISIILKGGYIEHLSNRVRKRRRPGMIIFRKAEKAHRIELRRDKNGKIIPAWTIFIFGRNRREWGFICPQGWVNSKDFLDESNGDITGKGCNQ